MAKRILIPEFPKIHHLPWKPNTVSGDIVDKDASIIFKDNVRVEEKVDGASVGIALVNSNPIIRNRNHILNKGYLKDTPAKMQFRPLWNWFYENKKLFEKLNNIVEDDYAIVYGEWMYAQHGMKYNALPSYFIAYELYLPRENIWASKYLEESGFVIAPKLTTKVESYEQLENLTMEKSAFADTQREGIVVKTYDDKNKITNRFKMVRQGFVQGALWSNIINKNELA